MVKLKFWHLGNLEYSFITITLRFTLTHSGIAQLTRAIEYTDYISAEGLDHPLLNECLRYNIKQFDGEVPVLEIWGIWSTPSLPLLPGLLCPRVVAPDRVLSNKLCVNK